MGFWRNITDAGPVGAEIVHFEAYEKGYYAILRRGDRLDIIHSLHLQPPVEDPGNYFAFMFVETLQGFFLLRQRVFENRPENWEVYLEITAAEPHRFFSDACAHWWRAKKLLDGGE